MQQDEQPYRIWHPQIADEQTYRNLVERYPEMRYQVGRACAAAGYQNLYRDLVLLPDIAIAKEGRESETDGGHRIYDSFLNAPSRYPVMNGGSLTINMDNPLSPAFFNGDTQVRLKLFHRNIIPKSFIRMVSSPDIEEDRYINDGFVWPNSTLN